MIEAAKKNILAKRDNFPVGSPEHRHCSNTVQNLTALGGSIHWLPQDFYIKKNLALNADALAASDPQ